MGNFFILLSFIFSKFNYCSCIPLGPIDDKQYNDYNLIATGKVVKVLDKDFERIIYFRVDSYFKGGNNQSEIKINTPKEEGMCGIVPKIGESWLMFTYSNGNDFRTSLCTRTKTMNPQAWNYRKIELIEDIKYLESKISANRR